MKTLRPLLLAAAFVACGATAAVAHDPGVQTIVGTYDHAAKRLTFGDHNVRVGSKSFRRLLSASTGRQVSFLGRYDISWGEGHEQILPESQLLTGRVTAVHSNGAVWLNEGTRRTLITNMASHDLLTASLFNRHVTMRAFVIETDGERLAVMRGVKAKLITRVMHSDEDRLVVWKPLTEVWVEGIYGDGPHRGKWKAARTGDRYQAPVPRRSAFFGPEYGRVEGKLERRGTAWIVGGTTVTDLPDSVARRVGQKVRIEGLKVRRNLLKFVELSPILFPQPRAQGLIGHVDDRP